MASIGRGEQNRIDLLCWLLSDNGHLFDAESMAFQIWDSHSSTPVQVFPSVVGEWQELVGSPGNPSIGTYYAYDPTLSGGWTPELTEALGRHTIKWRWRADSTSQYQYAQEEFEVMPVGFGVADQYLLIQDIRDAGLLSSVASDQKVLSYIRTWEQVIERLCRQWFSPKSAAMCFDGDGSDTAFLPIPVIAVEMLCLNSDTVAADSDTYAVYSGQGVQDHRRNPRISLVANCGSIFYGTQGIRPKFLTGRQNQYLSGIFGFVDEGNLTPPAIRRAALKLVLEKLSTPIYVAPGEVMPVPPILGAVQEEWTDGHKLKYAATGASFSSRNSGWTGITSDTEIIDILLLYRAPKGIASPADWFRP